MTKKNQLTQSIVWLALLTGGILLIPLIAMQFTNEVVWTISDFIFAGALIFGTGLTYKLITRKEGKWMYRVAVGLACATGFLLIWANGAVGIIGSEANPMNLWFYGVLAVGLIGALISRFQPKGMAFTLFATTFAHALVALVVLVGGYYQNPPSSAVEIIGVNGFFILLWASSALMFRYVEERNGESELKMAS